MTKGRLHEDYKILLGQIVTTVSRVVGIARKSLGETTWKRPELTRGIEADQCYYFDPAKLQAYAAALRSNDVDLYPNPDLAVEVDVSKPKIDRPGIYAALEVPEIWRAGKQTISIEQLGADGKYVPAPRSRFLPVRSEDVTRWIFSEDSVGMLEWEDRLRDWVRTQLVSRTESPSSEDGA